MFSDENTSKPPSNFQGVQEDSTKLITEANKRFLEEHSANDSSGDNKWKKTVTSNWDRYEIQPSDEEGEEDEMTGQAWDLAFSSGSSAQAHIRLKDEESWSTTGENNADQLSKDFFNLDINILDDLLKCVPLHKQIDLDKLVSDEETFELFDRKAEEFKKLLSSDTCDTSEINDKMMSLLSSSTPPKSLKGEFVKPVVQNEKSKENLSSSFNSENISVDIPKTTEFKDKDFNTGVIKSAPQEQRQRKNRNRRAVGDPQPQPDPKPKVSMQEYLKEGNQSDKATVKSNNIGNPSFEENSISTTENEDIEFLSSIEKKESKSKEIPDTEDASNSKCEVVVPVTFIDDKEKKGLEDWLDDFLGD